MKPPQINDDNMLDAVQSSFLKIEAKLHEDLCFLFTKASFTLLDISDIGTQDINSLRCMLGAMCKLYRI